MYFRETYIDKLGRKCINYINPLKDNTHSFLVNGDINHNVLTGFSIFTFSIMKSMTDKYARLYIEKLTMDIHLMVLNYLLHKNKI